MGNEDGQCPRSVSSSEIMRFTPQILLLGGLPFRYFQVSTFSCFLIQLPFDSLVILQNFLTSLIAMFCCLLPFVSFCVTLQLSSTFTIIFMELSDRAERNVYIQSTMESEFYCIASLVTCYMYNEFTKYLLNKLKNCYFYAKIYLSQIVHYNGIFQYLIVYQVKKKLSPPYFC